MARKSQPQVPENKGHAATLREHTAQLKRHARVIDQLTSANRSMAAALKLQGVALRKIPSREQIRAGIADAMSNNINTVKPGDLDDADKVVISGGAGILFQFLGKLNGEFWSDGVWHITPADLKGITVGKLIDLILKRLGG
jgi:hypothetical protein